MQIDDIIITTHYLNLKYIVEIKQQKWKIGESNVHIDCFGFAEREGGASQLQIDHDVI